MRATSPLTTLLLKQMTQLRQKGKTNKEIANLIGYSTGFVQLHLSNAGVPYPKDLRGGSRAPAKPKKFKKIKAVGME